ncbi:MAG TPA: glycosyltransferase family 39 protein, partial [Spirochaetia bacterium]|nr:glycosyltransferase family 39 protein [Spirochaetia bacterium]
TFPYTSWSFSYSQTSPPGLYYLGNLIHEYVSARHYLAILALVFLAFNISGLWLIYGLLWKCIANSQLRYCAAAFVTFIPFRVIHSIVIAADAFTLPIFALVAFFTLRLFGNPRSGRSWAGMCLCLSLGLLCKYTFAGMLPPLALLLAVAVGTHLKKGERLRWGLVGTLSLALPSALFLAQVREINRVNGAVTGAVWLRKGEQPVMRWNDILLLKRSDLDLLSAPGYFRGKLFEVRRYSYLGLVHVSSVTDVMDLFQPPPKEVSTDWIQRTREPLLRDRTQLSQHLEIWSVRVCVVYSALAMAGTLFCGFLSVKSLLVRRPLIPNAAIVITALAAGFYSPVFFSLTRLIDSYGAGFWLPRLVLPALLIFYSLGFVMLDILYQHLGRLQTTLRPFLCAFSGYTLGACLLFIGFLA